MCSFDPFILDCSSLLLFIVLFVSTFTSGSVEGSVYSSCCGLDFCLPRLGASLLCLIFPSGQFLLQSLVIQVLSSVTMFYIYSLVTDLLLLLYLNSGYILRNGQWFMPQYSCQYLLHYPAKPYHCIIFTVKFKNPR